MEFLWKRTFSAELFHEIFWPENLVQLRYFTRLFRWRFPNISNTILKYKQLFICTSQSYYRFLNLVVHTWTFFENRFFWKVQKILQESTWDRVLFQYTWNLKVVEWIIFPYILEASFEINWIFTTNMYCVCVKHEKLGNCLSYFLCLH